MIFKGVSFKQLCNLGIDKAFYVHINKMVKFDNKIFRCNFTNLNFDFKYVICAAHLSIKAFITKVNCILIKWNLN